MKKIALLLVISLLLFGGLAISAEETIEVTNSNFYKSESASSDNEIYELVGEVVNNSDKNLSFKITVTWFSSTGEVVDTSSDRFGSHAGVIRPKERIPFAASIRGKELNISDFKIHIQEDEAYTSGPRKLEVTQSSSSIVEDPIYSEGNVFKVTGMVKNVTEETVKVYAIVGFYNEKEQVISVKVAQGATYKELEPGESIGFKASTRWKVDDIQDYKVLAGEFGGI